MRTRPRSLLVVRALRAVGRLRVGLEIGSARARALLGKSGLRNGEIRGGARGPLRGGAILARSARRLLGCGRAPAEEGTA